MSKILGRDFDYAAELKTVRVPCPELDCVFILRELEAAQALYVKGKNSIQQLALMLIDESGQLIYDAQNESDIKSLGRMSMTIFNRLLVAAAELNGIGESIEDAIKNLRAGQNGDSEYVSPAS